jgi:rhodanese-related sulfurtransferase
LRRQDAQHESVQEMETMEFKNLYDLESGFDGWKKAGKPIEK